MLQVEKNCSATDEIKWQAYNTDDTDVMAFVDYLTPYTNYQFEVLAINDGGSGESETFDETTLEAGLFIVF